MVRKIVIKNKRIIFDIYVLHSLHNYHANIEIKTIDINGAI